MKNFNIIGSLKNPIFREGGGFLKNQFIGGLPKKVALVVVFFRRREWYPNAQYALIANSKQT